MPYCIYSVTSYLKYDYGSQTIHGVPSCRQEQAEFAHQYGIRYTSQASSVFRPENKYGAGYKRTSFATML